MLEKHLKLLTKGIVETSPKGMLAEKLKLNRPLIIKAGFDPTSANLHLGHSVLIQKLKVFQDLGHEVVFVVGDFTAMIGDPTGKNKTRPPLSKSDIQKNAKTYAEQVFKLLDRNKTKVVYNSSWMDNMDASTLLKLASQQTVARMLEREDFQKRYKNEQSIAIHEFLYPIMQGYDSVQLNADVELGGSDQTFNLLVGRDLQRQAQQEPQVIITLPLLEGLDGINKMSKSLKNTIDLQDEPEDMFGKIMSISDDLMWKYWELLTDVPQSKINEWKVSDTNPKIIKENLASEIVTKWHSEALAKSALESFSLRFSEKMIPADLAIHNFSVGKGMPLANLLKAISLVDSTSDAHRMIKQNAVKIDGEKISENLLLIANASPKIIQVGKRKVKKILFTE